MKAAGAAETQYEQLLTRAAVCNATDTGAILRELHELPPSAAHSTQIAAVLDTLSKTLGKSHAELYREYEAQAPTTGSSEKKSLTTRIVELVQQQGAELWSDPHGRAFVTVDVDGRLHHLRLKGEEGALWLRHVAYKQLNGVAPGKDVISTAISQLEAQALFEGATYEAYLRVALYGEKDGARVYVALHDAEHRVVEIYPGGWRVVSSSDVPVRFTRSALATALPVPQAGGGHVELAAALGLSHCVNEDGNEDAASYASYRSVVAWLLAGFYPVGTLPILVVNGPQGAGKTSLSTYACRLLDPAVPQLQTPARDERDLVAAALHTYVLAFDNVSDLRGYQLDAMARLASGSGLRARRLYTDSEYYGFEIKRLQLTNAIPDVIVQSDVLDRSIFSQLTRIPEQHRVTEAEREEEFRKNAPAALGFLCDVVAYGLSRLASGEPLLNRKPRLADFANWIVACSPALEWDAEGFVSSLVESQTQQALDVLEAHTIVPVLLNLVGESELVVTPTNLLKNVQLLARELELPRGDEFPRTAQALGRQLSRIAPALKALHNVEITRERTRTERRWRLVRLRPESSQSSRHPWTTRKARQAQGFHRDASGDTGRHPVDRSSVTAASGDDRGGTSDAPPPGITSVATRADRVGDTSDTSDTSCETVRVEEVRAHG